MRILFVDHTLGHDPKKLYEKPTGGTLTSLTLVPKYLASKGHEVYVRSMYEKNEIVDGVHYIDSSVNIPTWDVVVFNRNVLPKDFITYNKTIGAKIVWWLHDVVDLRYLPDDAYTQVDHVVALSDYCKRTFHDFYMVPNEKFTIIPNGVDKKVYYPGKYEDRNPNLYVMASALIKGFIPIETVYDNLQRINPKLEFRIYSNQALHSLVNSPQQDGFLTYMKDKGAQVYQPVSQEVLAKILRKAWCLVMPNSYPEICSNLILQARACGCPIVTSDIGANPEFVQNEVSGLMTNKFKPHDLYAWVVEFARLVCKLATNGKLHTFISENTPKDVLSWEDVGEKWDELLKRLIA